jgi:hypothetical protein
MGLLSGVAPPCPANFFANSTISKQEGQRQIFDEIVCL